MNQQLEVLVLRLRSAVADKEMVVNQANRDIQCYNGWSCDYNQWKRDCDDVIGGILNEIEVLRLSHCG